MPALLAKLADLKSLLNTSSTDQDTLLARLLLTATEAAEGLVGVDDGCLRRQENMIDFSWGSSGGSSGPQYRRFIRLSHMPIESVASVKQLYSPGSLADFAAAEVLVEDQDFVVDSVRGKLERLSNTWYAGPRCLQVVYTGGYIDPAATTIPSGAILPPQQLQHGICQEAIRLFQRRDMGGVKQASNSAGSVQIAMDQVHPDLIAAVATLRRII